MAALPDRSPPMRSDSHSCKRPRPVEFLRKVHALLADADDDTNSESDE